MLQYPAQGDAGAVPSQRGHRRRSSVTLQHSTPYIELGATGLEPVASGLKVSCYFNDINGLIGLPYPILVIGNQWVMRFWATLRTYPARPRGA